jgi:hypothetical protein
MSTFAELLQTDVEQRDQAWETAFLKALPQAPVRVLNPDPQEGPDHWPYLLVEAGDPQDEDSMENVIGWLSARGIGLAINPTKPSPDYVLTYGMIWNYRERGEFLTETEASRPKAGLFEVKNGQQLWVGAPSAQFLPAYVRPLIKQFLADQGVFTPKVLMVSADNEHFDLCFSIESLKSPPAHEHSNIAEALSWFLPAHYSVGLLSEKTVQGFAAL